MQRILKILCKTSSYSFYCPNKTNILIVCSYITLGSCSNCTEDPAIPLSDVQFDKSINYLVISVKICPERSSVTLTLRQTINCTAELTCLFSKELKLSVVTHAHHNENHHGIKFVWTPHSKSCKLSTTNVHIFAVLFCIVLVKILDELIEIKDTFWQLETKNTDTYLVPYLVKKKTIICVLKVVL